MALQIDQFMCRSDNFGVLLHDAKSGQTALIDAPEEAPILAAVKRTGWTPTVILTTHHHADHVEANLALKQKFKLKIVGPKAEAAKIPGIDETLAEGSQLEFAGQTVHVIETPGHTAGHICYYLPKSSVAFVADTLFALGCGRLLERPAPVMFESLKKLAALPADTRDLLRARIYARQCALRADDRPDQFGAEGTRRQDREACAPTGSRRCRRRIGEELATNPFLRWHDPAIRRNLGMENAPDVEVFAEIRKRKDNF